MGEDFKIVKRKSFNVAGPCIPSRHYMLSATERLPGVTDLIVCEQFFVIHAARHSGKTTALKYLTERINASGNMCAVYCSLEAAQQFSNPAEGLSIVTRLVNEAAQRSPTLEGRYRPLTIKGRFDDISELGVCVRNALSSIRRRSAKTHRSTASRGRMWRSMAKLCILWDSDAALLLRRGFF